jgi:hypothetical protein
VAVCAEIFDEARQAYRELRLIAKSRRRERRPTHAELKSLDAHFQLRDKRSDIPMLDIWHFAITSTRAGPTTVSNDLTWIQRVLIHRASLRDVSQPQLDLGIVPSARKQCKKLQ